jgi:hypothetical protein
MRLLSQRKGSAADNLTVDADVYLVGAHPDSTRAEIVHVLAAINPEV